MFVSNNLGKSNQRQLTSISNYWCVKKIIRRELVKTNAFTEQDKHLGIEHLAFILPSMNSIPFSKS